MKLSKRKKNSNEAQLNLPAMVDVILLLLIFFMCTRSFNEPEKVLHSKILKQGITDSLELKDIEPIEITLSKIKSGIVLDCDGRKFENFESLSNFLKSLRKVAEVEVIIKSNNNVPFKYVAETLERCTAAGFSNTGLSTVELGK